MKTLVTGANGFIGSAVVRALLEKGEEVKALVRINSDCRNFRNLPVELVYGDLTDEASLAKALKGCRSLFHVGAYYRLWARDPSLFYKINVEGTRNIMVAALNAGVERIVYTSSIAALGMAPEGGSADEETPVDPGIRKGHYKQSKYLAEAEVSRLIKERSLPAVIVNPTAPVGPGDIKPTPTGRVIRDAAFGRIPAFVDTGLNIAHVDDVAKGHIQAFERGQVGERYILGGENLSLKQILETIAGRTHNRPPKVRLSPRMVLPLAYAAEAWARVTDGEEPMITVDGVRLSRYRMYFSSDKARQRLGYRPRPADKALVDAVAWFQGEAGVDAADVVSSSLTAESTSVPD
ncbi:hopanoid-associated sugar epimerase [Methylosarcina fibrata]|uniref:hopanoid-associated sugar epimerase n=1 Tax=Methylosarcina fibrata TaxID=105972 RepID=UPI0003771D21|nr:hopanoid-associated sugar epimerase [Methylosarcina fibrata]